MPGPLDPRLVRRARATKVFLAGGLAVGVATALLTLGQARVLADSIAGVFSGGGVAGLPAAVGVLAAIFAGKGLLAWANQWLGQRAAAAVKSQLRGEIVRARLARPLSSGTSTASLITLVTKGLDALDNYYAKYLPQLLLAATVPLIVGLAVLGADLTSAVILAVTLPLIPLFMMLVGWTTQARTERRWATQNRLANHFADLVAGLPTLQVFGRAKAQVEGLRRTEAAHRSETLGTLRISFLSALVLELLATLSVAVVAVTVGFRVVFGDLDLATALFVLILAPEAYLPVRQVGAHFHDSADGVTAADAAFALIDEARGEGAAGPSGSPVSTPTSRGDAPAHEAAPTTPASTPTSPAVSPAGAVPTPASLSSPTPHCASTTDGPVLVVDGVAHTYPGADRPALEPTSFAVGPGEIVALAGPSGAGKSTLLHAVMGFLSPAAGRIERSGAIAWVGQQPGLVHGTVADNVRLGHPGATDLAVREALDLAGAAALPADQLIGDDAEGVSAGERRRIAVARALLRVTLGRARLLVLDEPTAGLDADTEAILLGTLRRLGVAVLVVSHRPAVLAEADRVVTLTGAPPVLSGEYDQQPPNTCPDDGPGHRAHTTIPAATAERPRTDLPVADDRSARTAPSHSRAEGTPAAAAAGQPAAQPAPESACRTGNRGSLLHRVFAAVPGARARLVGAVLLSFLATGASVALMATSGWLLSRAAEHPPVLYLSAAATL
ncbi:MAG: thiol reductant ABC exporter subunit CydD, partial [Propionicimonas sp.]|nr:thiol reductant ABC exporter subunit CydD [Propionicimonas sp.]